MGSGNLFTNEIFFETVPEWLSSEFARLPQDQYLPEGYRFRRLSRFRVHGRDFEKLPHAPYTQNMRRGLNTLMGNVERSFEEIENTVLGSLEFREMLDRFLCAIGAANQSLFLNVHFIRNICTPTQPGYPAPEGVHRDGFDFVGILCVSQERAKGAITELFLSEGKTPVFKEKLPPGHILLLDDSKLLHYTSPIEVEDGDVGFRDTVIFTVDFLEDLSDERETRQQEAE